ncbi:MAG: hypothetical protein IJU23_13355 [Proteobacteria bacterium]|nr:hypothetical protein [Pseudomonadota bacterium]
MSETNEQNTSQLDLSIVQIDIGPEKWPEHHRPDSGFWRNAFADGEMALATRKLITEVHIEKPLSIDYTKFVEHIAELHVLELESGAEPTDMERPNELEDQVRECTPQFILRNIPKIEHYYDLERVLPFNVEDPPKMEAEDLLEEMRNAHVGKVEFGDYQSVKFVDDFRSFLEEIFYLCPWDQITRGEPDEDSPWHVKNSTSELAKDLLTRRNKLYIFTESGMKQSVMKSYEPRKKDDSPAEACPFTQTFGPG